MMKIAITAESTIDLTKELLEKYDIKTLPFTVILGDNEYKDGEINSDDIFKFVEENKILPKTSAINEAQYNEFFESVLKDYDEYQIPAGYHIPIMSLQEFSTAYSTGSSLDIGYANPLTIIAFASSSDIPLDIK